MINTNQLSYIATNQEQAVIRALSSITSEQADAIGAIIYVNKLAWKVQIVDDYDGYRSIFVEPINNGHRQKICFISGTRECLELFESQDDDLTPIGTFTNAEAIGAGLIKLLSL